MHSHSSAHRVSAVIASIAIFAGAIPLPSFAQAAPQRAWLFLRPHCAAPLNIEPTATVGDISDVLKNSPDSCANYRIRDPQSQETQEIQVGDTLDMDLVLLNPSHIAISSVNAALSYDPQVLEGVNMELYVSLPIPTPGELDFAPDEGIVKIAASANAGGEPINGLMPVARIQFTVKRHPRAGLTPVGFDDIQPGVLQGRTQIVALIAGEESNIVSPDLGALIVRTAPSDEPVSSSSTASSEPNGTSSSSAGSSNGTAVSSAAASSAQSSLTIEERTAFVLLQVQNVRAGTEGGSISLTWDPVRSVDTLGYNIYYGTEKGRYIQRHSVDPLSNSHVIRGLPVNAIYYLAVRAFNAKNEESAFSREVMIKTGDPRSSTAPLTLGDLGPNGQNPLGGDLTGNVPGESGLPTNMLVVLACAAIIGTAFAFRRQFASRTSR